MDDIDWEEKMLFIKGSRDLGKTTLILQHVKEAFARSKKALYVCMNNLQIVDLSIWEIAEYLHNHRGTHLFIDKIHKYANWSIELKNNYDRLPNLFVVFSSSSILQVYKGYADLSGRVVSYHLTGFSLHEFIQIETKTSLAKVNLSEIL